MTCDRIAHIRRTANAALNSIHILLGDLALSGLLTGVQGSLGARILASFSDPGVAFTIACGIFLCVDRKMWGIPPIVTAVTSGMYP